MDTFELLPSLAQGELAETSAPELVAAVFRARASGTLWLETPDSEIRCFFRAGDMCGSGAFKNFQTLAHVLLANDWVAALDIESSRDDAAAQGKRHGEVLVEKGLLTQDQLRTALGAQHTANLTRLLSLTEGRYDWRGWEPPPAWAREVVVDPVSCLIDALEQEQHAPRRRKVLSWLGRHAARLSLDWPELKDRVTLSADDRRAVGALASPRTLADFVKASRLPQTRAEALLVTLLLAGGAEPQTKAAAPARAAPAEVMEEVEPEPIEPLPEPELVVEAEPPRGKGRPAQASRAEIDENEAFARLDSLSLEELEPELERPAVGQGDMEDEPLELDLDPPRGPRGGFQIVDDPAVAVEQKLAPGAADESRSRELRKKMLVRGLRNLGGPPREQEAPAPAREPSVEQDDAEFSPEDQRFVDDVRSRARLASRQDAYARLGVSQGASSEQVKSAYLALAKRYHPDRAAGRLSRIRAEMETLFAELKEAYEAVGTAQARASYDEQAKAGGRSSSRKEEAVLSLKMGEVLLKKRDFDGALNKLRHAVDLDATGDALAALAWALVADPKGSSSAKDEAASLINRALRASGATARTYYVAGVLWRTKDPDSACDAFRKALDLDPHHSDAALELRLIEQRRGKQGKSGSGVLSGLLFGKRKS